MNEVTKLYKNANIKQDRMCEWTCKDSELCNLNCEHYGSMQLYYPPFTAEKQLELVKWLAINKGISINYDDRYFEWGMATDFYGGHFLDNFDECLADLVNAIWQDLTEEERKQIKNILE